MSLPPWVISYCSSTKFAAVFALWYYYNQRDKGQWAVHCTSPQSFNLLLIVGFTSLRTFVSFDWLHVDNAVEYRVIFINIEL